MKTADKIRRIYIIFALGIYPIFPGFHGYENISREKIIFLAACSFALLIALALSPDRKDFLKKAGFAEISIFIFAFTAIISFLCSNLDRWKLIIGQNYDGLFMILLFTLIFLLLSKGSYKKKEIIGVLLISSSLVSLICILQILAFNPLGLYPAGASLSGHGIDYSGVYLGTFGNQNLLSAYFSLLSPLFIYELLFSKNKKRFWLFLPVAMFLFISIKLRQSAYLISFCLCLLLTVIMRALGGRRTLYATVGFITALLLFFALVYFIKPKNETLFELHEILHGRVSKTFGSKRLMIWAETVQIFKRSPITGHGPASLPYLFTTIFKRFVPETGTLLISYLNSAHNEFLSHLAQLGALGLSAYILFISAVFKKAKHEAYAGFIMAATGYLIYSFFGNLGGTVMPMFYIIMALASAGTDKESG